jgi:carboxymethylenebutenolidase
MGKRLAESGYAVLVVNPFYRTKKAPTSSPHADFGGPATREALMGLAHSLTPETEVTDAKALTAWLDQQPSVDKSRKMGRPGTAWARRSSSAPQRRVRSASEPPRRSTAEAW